MDTNFITSYLLVCVGLGVPLAMDVLFATLGRLRRKESFLDWAIAVTVLHFALLALGFTGAWFTGQLHSHAHILVGLGGFALVAVYLYEEFCEKIGVTPKVALVARISRTLGIDPTTTRVWILATGVSIDAFLVGPLFVAIMTQEGWSLVLTYLAFGVIGVTVFLVTGFTLTLPFCFGYLTKRFGWQMVQEVATFHFWADLAVYSLIGGFGVLSLWSITGQENGLAYSILLSTLFWIFLFTIFRKQLMESEAREAHDIVD